MKDRSSRVAKVARELAGKSPLAIAEAMVTIEDQRNALFGMTAALDEHPENYDGPCQCRLCMSYADSGDQSA